MTIIINNETSIKTTVKPLAVLVLLVMAIAACPNSSAQSQSAQGEASQSAIPPSERPIRTRIIEEVIVSAQKREEAIQDVPISMSVMTGDFMVEQGINDLATALLFVPNVKVTSAGFFAAPNARGFTFNNNNKAFEPPLGLAIDGIPYTRIPYFLAATFDLQRIEVLRGPQGTTFGKNTTAGLIHMITNDPGDDYSGRFSAQEGELDRQRLELAVGGPVIKDVLNFRLAGFVDKRTGYVTNTTSKVDPNVQERFLGYDRDGFRAKLEFPDILGSRLQLSYEDVYLEDFGTGVEIIRASPEVKEFIRNFDPNTDFEQGNMVASMDFPDGRRVELKTFAAQWDYDLGDWGLVAVGGRSVLEQTLDADIDFSPAPASWALGGDKSPTETAEFRVLSPTFDGFFGIDNLFSLDLGSSDFVAGAFYQKREINDSFIRFVFDLPVFLGLTAAASGSSDGSSFPGVFELFPTQSEGEIFEDVTQNFEQSARTVSAFGEFKWHFLPDWSLQVGARYGTEEKKGSWDQVYNQEQPAVVLPEAGLVEFTAQRELEENQFQHKISLNWNPTDNISIFLHRAEAVKGGGFNAFAFRGVDDELVYDPEFTTEYSLNAKTTWLENTLAANIAVYRMDVDDFQVLIRDAERANIGIGVARVTNAAEARAQGVEADIQWRPFNWLTLIGTIGYNETEYLNFTNNECPADQPEEGGCDATGKSFPFTPEWNNTLTSLVRVPLFDRGLELTASVTVEQNSKQFLDIDLDERKVQGSFERYKASLGLGNPTQGWAFKIVGENLTDERTGIRQGDLFEGVFVESAEQPRLIYGQLTWTF